MSPNQSINQSLSVSVSVSVSPQDRVSLCSPVCPGAYSVDQAGLELRDPPASAFRVLGLKACTNTTQLISLLSMRYFPFIMLIPQPLEC